MAVVRQVPAVVGEGEPAPGVPSAVVRVRNDAPVGKGGYASIDGVLFGVGMFFSEPPIAVWLLERRFGDFEKASTFAVVNFLVGEPHLDLAEASHLVDAVIGARVDEGIRFRISRVCHFSADELGHLFEQVGVAGD